MIVNHIYTGDAATVLRSLLDNSIDCVVTRPPYYGLRDYGTAQWIGGNPECKHYDIRGDGEYAGEMQKGNVGSLRIAKKKCPSSVRYFLSPYRTFFRSNFR